MARRGEHRICVPGNAGGSGERASPSIGPRERWITEVNKNITYASTGRLQTDDKSEPKIGKLRLGEISYEPRAVTVGPYHRHQRTRIAEEDKSLIVEFMNRLYELDGEDCRRKMRNQVADARNCYVLPRFGSIDDRAFAELLLQDSYFILFLFMSGEIHSRLKGVKTDSPIDSMGDSLSRLTPIIMEGILQTGDIVLDLLIHSNQIPFFVIKVLFEKLRSKKPLHIYAFDFFEKIHPMSNKDRKGLNHPPNFVHLLDLFHWSRVSKDHKYDVVTHPSDRARYTPTLMELRESATRFEMKKSGSSLAIVFRRSRLISNIGVLNIPSIRINDDSKFIFHNLIAFEMQCPKERRCTMAFFVFMRNLLQSEGDVKLLRQCGILACKTMPDCKLVGFFEDMSQLTEGYQMPDDLSAVYDQVLSHHNHRMSQFYGSVILYYFPSPMVALSVFAAALIFVLALLQTIYSMLDYYHR